jgi:hypothetical protein
VARPGLAEPNSAKSKRTGINERATKYIYLSRGIFCSRRFVDDV